MDQPTGLDYFAGAVPTVEFFRLILDDLRSLIDRSSSSDERMLTLNEVCFIGLISYFEAFCKDYFASVLNIEPSLLENLEKQGYDVSINPSELLGFGYEWHFKIGFMVAEKFDFGSARKINALYGALLRVTPFSKVEIRRYEQILRDRNLLVHHAGVYNLSYLRQAKPRDGLHRPFLDTLPVSPEYFDKQASFIASVARKISMGAHAALERYIGEQGIVYSREKIKAVRYLLWGNE